MKKRSVSCWAGRDFEYDPSSTALIVIDMQRDFLSPGGMNDHLGDSVETLSKIIPNTKRLLDWARKMGLHIIHTRESYLPDMSDVSDLKRKQGYIALDTKLGRSLIRGDHAMLRAFDVT